MTKVVMIIFTLYSVVTYSNEC